MTDVKGEENTCVRFFDKKDKRIAHTCILVKAGIRMALLGMRTSIQRHFVTLYNNNYYFLIIVRGRFRVGVGVDVNKTQSNR